MGNRRRKGNEKNLKKKLLDYERRFGRFIDYDETQENIHEQDSTLYQTHQSFSEEQTNSNPEKSVSEEIESIRNWAEIKLTELRSEMREDAKSTSDQIAGIHEKIRNEGNSIRTGFISRNLFFWIVGGLVVIVFVVISFFNEQSKGDIQRIEDKVDDIDTELKEVKHNLHDISRDVEDMRRLRMTQKNSDTGTSDQTTK